MFVFRGVRAALSFVFCVVFCISLFLFSGVRVALTLVFSVVCCRSLFVLSGVRVNLPLVFYVGLCRLLLVLLSLISFGHVLNVLRFTSSDYPFGVFKLCPTVGFSFTFSCVSPWQNSVIRFFFK